MTIGINLLYLIPGGVGGTEYYARSFVTELRRLDKKNKYIIFCGPETARTLHIPEKNWHVFPCPTPTRFRPMRILFEQFILPFILWSRNVEVLHSMGYFGPVVCPCRQVVTVHDVNWRDHPEDTNWLENLVGRLLIELNLRTAETIITDSPFSQRRLLSYFPFLREKLHTLQPGVDKAFLRELKGAKNSQPIFPFAYILTVSAYHPHKRLSALIPFWRQVSQLRPDLHLVIIGKNGRQERTLRPVFNSMERVHTKGVVPLTTLACLYAHAEAVVHPSIYEGFGYPVYEATAAGKDVYVGNADLYDEQLLSPDRLKRQYRKAARQLLRLYYSSRPSAPKY